MGIRYTRLLPFLFSDGGISPKGKRGWLIYFRNNSEALVDLFCKQLQELANNTVRKERRRDGSFFVRLDDLELGEKFLQISPCYRTKACGIYPKCPGFNKGRCSSKQNCDRKFPPLKIPVEIHQRKKLMREFLRIYLSCDGGVSVTVGKNPSPFLVRKVFVNSSHPYLRDGLMKMFNHLGFDPKLYKDQIRLTKRSDITRFAKEIRFLNGIKIGRDSRRFQGIEKNELLDMVSESYENPKKLITLIVNSYISTSSGLSPD